MCKYCEGDEDREIFQDMVGDWYLQVRTSHWDDYDDDFEYEKVWISYCPFCGRSLYD